MAAAERAISAVLSLLRAATDEVVLVLLTALLVLYMLQPVADSIASRLPTVVIGRYAAAAAADDDESDAVESDIAADDTEECC